MAKRGRRCPLMSRTGDLDRGVARLCSPAWRAVNPGDRVDARLLLSADQTSKQNWRVHVRLGDEAATRSGEHARPGYAYSGRGARVAALLGDRLR